ncbi:amidase [Amycolatopsis nalaikhensis]|uniref:Amidase family protein n=1 Tax=Amycolatopsis nalaikhensis TaxID=715472 RepID=A0ABY8XKV5_9PSEU|nr:amidase family protein [Amycolatopsis sp. 2-2]WIV56268.1 amidase family protein [Amycolatopsis sp. 2-2]
MTTVEDALTRAHRTRNTFLRITDERAAAVVSQGPLAGMPFAVKDIFDVRGTRTSAASRVFDDRPDASRDAEAVRRVTAAGAALIGKTTMSELAYSGLGVNERFGTPTLSRAGREHVVGGSSSGSAAAVRAGVVAFALASDTSGSARIPAAWVGVFGFRPSLGRYPSDGMTALAPTLDTAGLIAARLEHVEAVDRILGGDPGPAPEVPVFVVPHEEYLSGCDGDVLDRFHADLARLRAAGFRVAERRLESLELARRLHRLHVPIVESEAYAAFGRYLEEPDLLSSQVRRRLERARTRLRQGSADPLYGSVSSLRRQFRRELGNALLLSPATEIDAPAYDDVRASAEAHDEVNARALALTMVLSYLDAPSLVIPFGGGGLPRSIQVSGASGWDGRVLRAARQLGAAPGLSETARHW